MRFLCQRSRQVRGLYLLEGFPGQVIRRLFVVHKVGVPEGVSLDGLPRFDAKSSAEVCAQVCLGPSADVCLDSSA